VGARGGLRRIGVRVGGDAVPRDRGHVTHVTNIRLEMTIDGERAVVEWASAEDERTGLAEGVPIGDFLYALAQMYLASRKRG
jgi:hypothetical protein